MPKPLAFVLAGLLCTPALAASPRIAVLPFSGPGANAVRNPLVSALCEEATCIPSAKVSKGPKPDWKKLKKERVDFVVTGAVAKSKKKLVLNLQVLKAPGKAKLKKSYPLDRKGKLSEGTAQSASQAVLSVVGVKSRDPEPTPEPVRRDPEPVASRPDPVPTRREPEPVPVPVEPSSDRWASSASTSGEVSAPVDEPYRRKQKQPLLVVEVGPDVFARRFGYTGVTTRNLRSYSANVVVAPRISAELYPLSSSRGLVAGLGVEAGYSMAVGLQSRRADGPAHPTSLSRLDAGAKLKIRPGDGGSAIVPSLGYRSARFSVGLASDGAKLEGLPEISYSALVVGLGGELSLMDGKLVPFLKLAYLPVLSSGEIVSAQYFPTGAASGMEGAVGAALQVASGVEVRLSGQVTRYALTFTTQEGDPYVATGASDLYAGANLSVRYSY